MFTLKLLSKSKTKALWNVHKKAKECFEHPTYGEGFSYKLTKQKEDYFIKNPYINLSTAFFATIVLILFGAIAGYVPAKRAASIKPIVALRDE